MQTFHKPVLLQEAIETLDLGPRQIVVDGTLGGGGHAQEIIKNISDGGCLIAFDADREAINRSRERLEKLAKENQVELIFINDNFRNISRHLNEIGREQIDRVILDLGMSSDQLENSGKGFSFLKDEPLIMSFGSDVSPTALDILNTWSEEEIEEGLRNYGEEEFARLIARAICKERLRKTITRTTDLAEIIKGAVPDWYQHRRIHPATKTFQALRMMVNDELGALREFLSQAPTLFSRGGRLVIISFESLSDRIIKQQMVAWERSGVGKRIVKKAIKPGREELLNNKRSRSAKLRVCQFI